jgi:aspartyl-tRNA(Asn)/glutamyl-tRNA(Gln) amidotransferase subunit A
VPDWLGALTGDVRGLRIGIPSRWLDEGIDARVHRAFADALDVFRSRGAVIVDVVLPNARHAVPVYHLIATAEASSNLARYDGVRYGLRAPHAETLREMYEQSRETGFGPEVKRRIILGTFVLSAGYREEYYGQAQRVRTLIRRDYEAALSEVDAIATPTSPTTAFRLGERLADPIQMYLADVFTVGAPLAGLPAVSVPAGFDADRLPIGLQLVGRAFDEETILRIAEAYERETGWWREEPGVSAGSDH